MLWVLLRYYRASIVRYFHTDRVAKIIIASLFLVVGALLCLGVYAAFYRGFLYILNDSFFGEAISLYVIELFLLISSLLVFASALIAGVVVLFRPDDGPVLMSSPSYKWKPWLVLSRMLLTSLWPLLVIIAPGLVAIGQVFHLSPLMLIPGVLASIMLVAISVLGAMLLIFLMCRMLVGFRMFSKRNVLLASMFWFFLLLVSVWDRFRSVDLVDFFRAQLLSLDVAPISPIVEQFHVFPSHLASMSIFHGAMNSISGAWVPLVWSALLLCALTLLFIYISRTHLYVWQRAQEGSARSSSRIFSGVGTLMSRVQNRSSALFAKEVLAFLRNDRGMLWLAFILVIWGIQVGASRLLTRGLGVEHVPGAAVEGVAGTFLFMAVVYFIALFVLRFAFPSFSEERKRNWIVASAPVDMSRVFSAKLTFFSVIFSCFAAAFFMLSAFLAGATFVSVFQGLTVVLVAVATITIYGLALGAMYPNKETDDPELLSTTLPGLTFIFGALLYGALGVYAIALGISGALVFMLASLVLCWCFIIRARGTLRKGE